MSAFLAAVLAFPTVVFTVLLVFFLLYGLATLLGAVDIEWLDGVLGVDELDVDDGWLEGGMSALGVAGIPLTIVGGVSAVFAWLTSYVSMRFLGESSLVVDSVVGLGAAIVGLGLASIALRPVKKIFDTAPAPVRKAIVGKVCTIRSLRVDHNSGTAEVEDGGAGFIAEVRCFRENELTRGSKAIVFDYDAEEGIYHVGPIDPSIAN
jgi:hypothetical protein